MIFSEKDNWGLKKKPKLKLKEEYIQEYIRQLRDKRFTEDDPGAYDVVHGRHLWGVSISFDDTFLEKE